MVYDNTYRNRFKFYLWQSVLIKRGEIMTEGYCVKCKKKVEIKDGIENVNTKNMKMLKGKCPNCNTTVCRILGKAQTA